MEELRAGTVRSVIDHALMDQGFLEERAQRYVSGMSDADVLEWNDTTMDAVNDTPGDEVTGWDDDGLDWENWRGS